ncbi:hypothetical protein AALO_G00278050 [Alosa alosa]|uniref:Uncharacterized protein n=1 Tax=Alosa alosa TaxID=278164 RepID=A0AAV6FIQ4_9TELE|nr:hypothetical protein AALO_G00278050 [Alosa alosa]
MPRTQIYPEPPDLSSSQESIWSSVVQRSPSDIRLLRVIRRMVGRRADSSRGIEEEIETSEESRCSSTSSALGYRPTMMIRFPEVSPIHRVSQAALPPLLSTQCQPRTSWNQSQTPTLQAPGPSDTAIANATEVSPESPHPQVAEITRKMRQMDGASDLMDLIIVTRQRKLAELQILDLDVRGLPAKIKQMRRDHDYMIKAWERDRLQREADTMQLDGTKLEDETLAGVRDEVKTDAAALLLQQGSERTSQSCSSPVTLHEPNQSEASQSTQAKCTLTNVKERDHNKSGAVARPLPNGWKHASRPPLSSGPCSSENEGKDVTAQPRSSGLKCTSTFNFLSQNSLWSHGGQSDSDSENSDCSSFQAKCTFPHKLISVPDLPLRDHSHEPPSTLICASSLAIVARRNGTQSPPARASMNNKEDSVEDEMTDSESEDSSIQQEEATRNKDDPTQQLKELQSEEQCKPHQYTVLKKTDDRTPHDEDRTKVVQKKQLRKKHKDVSRGRREVIFTGTAATKHTGTVIMKLLVWTRRNHGGSRSLSSSGNSQLKASLEHRSIHLLFQHQPKEDGFPQQPGSSQGFFQLSAGSFSLPPLPTACFLGA